MSNRGRNKSDFQTLRKQAEQVLENQKDQAPDDGHPDMIRLIHELELYQIELEIQNEELRFSKRELETARDEYFELYDAAPVGFVTIESSGLIRRCNRDAARILAADREDIIGRPFSSKVYRDDHKIFFSYLKTAIAVHAAPPCELRLIRGDGTLVYVHCESAFKKDSEGSAHWRLALIDITERKEIERELKHRNDQLARLTSQLTLAEQRERHRLAELLHDHLQQLLAAARINLDVLSGRIPVGQEQSFINAYNLVVQSIDSARSLSADLSPPVLYQKGLGEALEWLSRWIEKNQGLKVDLHLQKDAPPIREDIKVILFASVRELLFNVAKYAGTDTARVEMTIGNGHLTITVDDQGVGFDPKALLQAKKTISGGFGLFTINERLRLMGGSFDITSSPGKGTRAVFSAPLNTADCLQPEAGAPFCEKEPADELHVPMAPESESEGCLRVLLVDDHPVMRNGLSLLLSRHPDIEIAGEASNGAEAVKKAREKHPDVILMDINMPQMNGLEATRAIHSEMPHIRIIGLSMFETEDQAAAMKQAGASAYLAKSGETKALLTAIREK